MQHSQKANDITSFASVRRVQEKASQRKSPNVESFSVSNICSIAQHLISVVMGADPSTEHYPNDQAAALAAEKYNDAAWDSLSNLAIVLSQMPVETMDDVLGKITVWRSLAPERGDGSASVDELLANSIMDDIEKFCRSCDEYS